MGTESFDITIAAGQEGVIHAYGSFVRCVDADQEEFRIGLDDAPTHFMAAGCAIILNAGEKQFGNIRIKNISATETLTVTMVAGSGDFQDDRQKSTGSITVSGGVEISNAPRVKHYASSTSYGVVSLAAGAASSLRGSNGIRKRERLFNNEPLGGETVYIGENSSVTTTTGFPLTPQQGIDYEHQRPIFGVHGGASAVDIRYFTENY